MTEKTIITVENPDFPLEALLKAVRMDQDADPDDIEELTRMRAEALAVARTKALFGIAGIEARDEETVTVDGVCFRSSLVSQNLANTNRLIPYVATCGTEAEEWSLAYQDDPLAQFWADAIKLQLLGLARHKLQQEVGRFFPNGKFSAMSPGSLPAWPLPQQRPLFDLLGGVTPDIGVTLTPSFLLLPSKSCSGFFFSAESHYENCRYCPILDCPGRRAPFEKELKGTAEYEQIFEVH